MQSISGRQRRVLYLLIGGAALVFVILAILLNRVIDNAVRVDVTGQTSATAATAALAVANAVREDQRLAVAVVGETGTAALVQQTASRAATNAIEYANINIQRANPQVTAFFYYDQRGGYVLGQTVTPSRQPSHQLSVSCDATNVYCIDSNARTQGFLATTFFQGRLKAALATPIQGTAVLAFERQGGAYGSLFILQPIVDPLSGRAAGALVEQVDGETIFGPYVQGGSNGNLVLRGNVVITHEMAAARARGQLPVTTVDPALSTAITGGLAQTPTGYSLAGENPEFSLAGTDVLASVAPVGVDGLRIVSYASADALSAARTRLVVAAAPFLVLLILCIIGPFYYQSLQAQRAERERARRSGARSETLAKDLAAVEEALAVVAGGGKQASGRWEVGRLSQTVSSLLAGYTQIAREVDLAAQAAATGIDQAEREVQRIGGLARAEAEALQEVETSMQRLAAVTGTLRKAAAETAATLSTADQAMAIGQEAVSRLSAAGVVTDTAARDSSREFQRLQEIRGHLAELLGALKGIAEQLQVQTAFATRESLLSESPAGVAYVTAIGRVARQAADAQADAERTIGSLASSVAELDRRQQRFAEATRLAAEETAGLQLAFATVAALSGQLAAPLQTLTVASGEHNEAARAAETALRETRRIHAQLLVESGSPLPEIGAVKGTLATLRAATRDLQGARGARVE